MPTPDENKGSVLVVDDMCNWRDTLRLIFEQEDYSVVCVRSITEAEAAIGQRTFDLVVLDIRLSDEQPRNEGIQFLQHIRGLGDETETIILTAYPEVQTIHQTLKELGARDYLIKNPEGGFDETTLNRFREVTREAIAASRTGKAAPRSDHGGILIVEDDQKWASLLSEALLAEQYSVEIAHGFQQAKDMIVASTRQDGNPYRLAVVDLQLETDASPDSQGAALLNVLARQSPGTEVIIVTAFPSARRVRDAFREYKARDFLSKDDFDVRDFLNAVRESFEEVSEQFFVAWFEGHVEGDPFITGHEYPMRVTCQQFRSPGYQCVRFWLPASSRTFRLHVIVHAQDMDVQPSIGQFLDIDLLQTRAQPLRFLVSPKESGNKRIMIDAYHDDKLLAMLRLQSVDVNPNLSPERM